MPNQPDLSVFVVSFCNSCPRLARDSCYLQYSISPDVHGIWILPDPIFFLAVPMRCLGLTLALVNIFPLCCLHDSFGFSLQDPRLRFAVEYHLPVRSVVLSGPCNPMKSGSWNSIQVSFDVRYEHQSWLCLNGFYLRDLGVQIMNEDFVFGLIDMHSFFHFVLDRSRIWSWPDLGHVGFSVIGLSGCG